MVTRIGIAVVELNNRFLVGVRSDDSTLAGYDEFPGGKCHSDESPRDCAMRECKEESGIQVTAVRELLNCQHTYDHGEVDLHFWLCQPADETSIAENGFQWIERSDLPSCRFPEANQPLIDALIND